MSVRVLRPNDVVRSTKRSQEREKLAEAIANLKEAEAEIKGIREAISTTEATIRSGQDALETANAEIEKAKIAAAEFVLAKAMGRATGAPVDIGTLRAAALGVQDEIDAATAARKHLQGKLGECEMRIAYKRDAVDKLWPGVVRESVEFFRLQQDFQTASQTYANLLHVFHAGIPVEVFNEHHARPEPDVEVAATWKAAIEALKRNADASLP
jgi:chromosome segregation ATPase